MSNFYSSSCLWYWWSHVTNIWEYMQIISSLSVAVKVCPQFDLHWPLMTPEVKLTHHIMLSMVIWVIWVYMDNIVPKVLLNHFLIWPQCDIEWPPMTTKIKLTQPTMLLMVIRISMEELHPWVLLIWCDLNLTSMSLQLTSEIKLS